MEEKRIADINILELGINNTLRWANINNIKIKLDFLDDNKFSFNVTKIKYVPNTIFDVIASYGYFILSVETVDKHDNKNILNSLNLIKILNSKQSYKEVKLILSYI